MLTPILGLSLLLGAIGQDEIKINRVYKDKATDLYKVDVKVDQSNMKLNVASDLKVTITGEPKEGSANARLEIKDVKMSQEDRDMPNMGDPDLFDTTLDRFGMTASMPLQDIQAIYTLFGVSSYVPQGALKVGGEYPVSWESKDQEHLRGKMTFLELGEVGGVKVAVFQSDIEIKPAKDTPAQYKVKTYIALDSGALVKAEGKLEADDANVEIKFEQKKQE